MQDLKALIRSRFEPRSGRDAQPGYDKILAEEFELFSSENSNLQITDANFGPVTCSNGITMAFIVGHFGIVLLNLVAVRGRGATPRR